MLSCAYGYHFGLFGSFKKPTIHAAKKHMAMINNAVAPSGVQPIFLLVPMAIPNPVPAIKPERKRLSRLLNFG